MTAADGEQPAGQQPAPEPTRTLRFQVAGGLVRPRPAPEAAAPEAAAPEAAAPEVTAPHAAAPHAAAPHAAAPDAAALEVAAPYVAASEGLPATVGAVGRLLAATVRTPEPAPPLPSRRHRTPRLPKQRHWYSRPLPAAIAVGGLVTVTATGLAEGLAPGAPGASVIPAARGTGSTLRGALLVPAPQPAPQPPGQRLPVVRPTPGEVPPRTVTVATPAADSSTGAPSSAGPDRTDRPQRLRKPRRSRTRPASGTGRSSTGTGTQTGTQTVDPTGQVTLAPP